MHPKKEKTFVIFKPDSVQRGLVGEIIHRFERVGLKIVAMKMVLATEDQCWKHYNKDEAWYIKTGNRIIENRKAQNKPIEKEAIEYGKDVVEGLVKYMTCSPVVIMVLEGNSSRAVVKRLVGGTEPVTADTGTIRGDLTLDSYYLCDADDGRAVRNLIHCTDPADGEGEAGREISVWFKEDEIVKWISINEKMLYDVDLNGHLE
jgi:nucleoside-diphosphate kinase